MMNFKCCVACGWGSAEINKNADAQIEKFGENICVKCEDSFNSILESEEELRLKTGFGVSETLITKDTIYYFEADRPKVCDPKAPFLGFGGSWFLITKDQKTKYGGSIRKAFVSNNLFHDRSIPKSFRERFLEKGKVNATVVGISKQELISLKDQLNRIPYLNEVKP
ncbi:hypothetical protein J27TS8_04890 [Robertmurraya siralis]|uniref:Uncharacterized protein n=1 Tax=Robertmurraya siralis TaxID=77777 RepID=A0A919WEZ1_9BACI|nr:hypothetical protein [Robertmurraya siralis]GIN60496.1 hypothetical protein J27TS8_04890 [Robertmurraya siralis]